MKRQPWLILGVLLVVVLSGYPGSAGLPPEQREAVHAWLKQPRGERDMAVTTGWGLPDGMSVEQASDSLDALWEAYCGAVVDDELGTLPPTLSELLAPAEGERQKLQPGSLTLGELIMPYVVLRRESQPVAAGGRPLLICTHGGGRNEQAQGPHAWAVNTREWRTQIQFAAQLYAPDGIYFVPRMADDRLGRWWHRHNHDAFERVVEHAIAHWGVDPNRVYKLGISEGGYGTAILAAFMPDRFAGANAMAAGIGLGNPPDNLRNLAFRTDVGERDTTYDRVGLAQRFHARLDKLHRDDPAGYRHHIGVQPGRGHGIDYRPGVAWIAEQARNPWPDQLVWVSKALHDRRRTRHYWIEIPAGLEDDRDVEVIAKALPSENRIIIEARQIVIAGDGGNPTHVQEGQRTREAPLSGVTLRILLHDELLDLGRPVQVTINGEGVFAGTVKRSAAVQLRTLATYGDPTMAASAEVVLDLP